MSTTAAGDLSRVIASAAAGDESAFAHLVATHHGEMVRICTMISRDRLLAEEGVQLAWAIAWRKIHTVREPANLRAWLITVATNETRKLLKKRSRRAEVEMLAAAQPQANAVDPATGIAWIDVQAALERLAPEDRQLLVLRYVAGFDATELSHAVGLKPGGVRTRLKRLLDALRQELSDG